MVNHCVSFFFIYVLKFMFPVCRHQMLPKWPCSTARAHTQNHLCTVDKIVLTPIYRLLLRNQNIPTFSLWIKDSRDEHAASLTYTTTRNDERRWLFIFMRSVLIIISNAFQSKLISHPEWTLKTVCLLFCWWVGIVADRDMFVWILIRSLKSCTNALLPTTPIFMCLNLHCDWIHKMDFRWKNEWKYISYILDLLLSHWSRFSLNENSTSSEWNMSEWSHCHRDHAMQWIFDFQHFQSTWVIIVW